MDHLLIIFHLHGHNTISEMSGGRGARCRDTPSFGVTEK
jgi:hypothetical protein